MYERGPLPDEHAGLGTGPCGDEVVTGTELWKRGPVPATVGLSPERELKQ